MHACMSDNRGGSRNSLKGGGSGPEFFEVGVWGPGPWEFSYTDKQKKEKPTSEGGV